MTGERASFRDKPPQLSLRRIISATMSLADLDAVMTDLLSLNASADTKRKWQKAGALHRAYLESLLTVDPYHIPGT